MTCKTWRNAPGETDTWYLRILSTRMSMAFSTKQPRTFLTMDYKPGGCQAWHSEDLGYTPLFPSITGGIFEFGFTDAILQMWAAFIDELVVVMPVALPAPILEKPPGAIVYLLLPWHHTGKMPFRRSAIKQRVQESLT